MTDLGINDGFLKEVGEALKPGKAALCLLVKEATTDRVIEKLRRHAGHTQLLQTNLSHTDEDHLKELLDQAKQQAEALRLAEQRLAVAAADQHHAWFGPHHCGCWASWSPGAQRCWLVILRC